MFVLLKLLASTRSRRNRTRRKRTHRKQISPKQISPKQNLPKTGLAEKFKHGFFITKNFLLKSKNLNNPLIVTKHEKLGKN